MAKRASKTNPEVARLIKGSEYGFMLLPVDEVVLKALIQFSAVYDLQNSVGPEQWDQLELEWRLRSADNEQRKLAEQWNLILDEAFQRPYAELYRQLNVQEPDFGAFQEYLAAMQGHLDPWFRAWRYGHLPEPAWLWDDLKNA